MSDEDEMDDMDDMDEAIKEAFHNGEYPMFTDEMLKLIGLFGRQWREGGEWGNMHIIVADQNLEDEHIKFCRLSVWSDPDKRQALDIETLDAMAAASYEERLWAYLIADEVERLGMTFTPHQPT